MAPVKRSVQPTQRETRTTRAAAVAKKKAVDSNKNSEVAPITNKPTVSKRDAVETRKVNKTKNTTQDNTALSQDVDQSSVGNEETARTTRTRATRATPSSQTLAAAPRRRIRITPLDAPTADIAAVTDTTEDKKRNKKDVLPKKASTRSTANADGAVVESSMTTVESKPARKKTSKTEAGSVSESAPMQKPRGRPRSQKKEEPEVITQPEAEIVTTKRTTRSQRAGSPLSANEILPDTASNATNPVNGMRKKVTFQDLPTEMDKENLPLTQSKAKKGTAAAATGLRAKPLRRAAASTATSRARKAGTQAAKGSNTGTEAVTKSERKINRVLTPKKITQVAKSSSPTQHESEISEGEDELNGGKTPIRDLSVSPRRPANPAIARALSPAKKLDFGQSLVSKSPNKTSIFRDTEAEPAGMLASPARRPAASPFKNGLKASPIRGLEEGTNILFPRQDEQTVSIAINALNNNGPVSAMSTMLQSPKRAGLLDSTLFSQSTAKKSMHKSPLKTSLFGTPAKRLFSPTKKRSSPTLEVVIDEVVADTHVDNEPDADEMELESEITASSHFRPSSSPLRVIRADTNVTGVDFDDSILQVGSPLKIRKSPLKVKIAPGLKSPAEIDDTQARSRTNTASSVTDVVEPASLDLANQVIATAEIDEDVRNGSATSIGPEDNGEVSFVESEDHQADSSTASASAKARTSVSQILFRSADPASEEESSEDELAGDKTPIGKRTERKPRPSDNQSRFRLSTGVPQSVSGRGFGFTPLAAQMSGWLATSPEKSPEQHVGAREMSAEFSPLARQHIEGEVVISRDSTPVQKLSKRTSLAPSSALKSGMSSKKPSDLRKSMAQRQSLGLFAAMDSPARNPQFEEYMEIRAMEEQAELEKTDDEHQIDVDDQGFDEVMAFGDHAGMNGDGDETILDSENGDSANQDSAEPGDLTTDLINFTHASDTAMVDFQQLAEEANELASESHENEDDGTDNDKAPIDVQGGRENAIASDIGCEIKSIDGVEHSQSVAPSRSNGPGDIIDALPEPIQEFSSPVLRAVTRQLDSPSVLVIDEDQSLPPSPSSPVYSSVQSPAEQVVMQTPRPNLNLNERRIINTVVSKVPLKPEGLISPIKMTRKRSRSFGNTDSSPAKRISFENLRPVPSISNADATESPDRRVRTSVAPSPGGTSTPATTKSYTTQSSRYSYANHSTTTTPGQMSFAIDDFGDSTLDGIELPEDFEDITRPLEESETPVPSVRLSHSASSPTTPKAMSKATPATAKQSTRRVTTPVSSKRKTPKSSQKASTRASLGATMERMPLESVGKGVLYGATVFVDVHTSEGADASGIFVELLTQMGAKCVKDWRWNSRASLAIEADLEASEQKIGITHVVFKDGGKRTLEKVRDAKGEVCCVGVAWVLDCERENKWLDESNYTIDTSIAPRGGSKRRKSMQPKALSVSNDGSVSASRPRRSVSAEMSELMKQELVNTPIRGQSPAQLPDDDEEEENDENAEQATPTGFVSYDPRVAMTPGTPYLVSQGRKLTQMSAPPKQHNRSLFEDEDEENDEPFGDSERGSSGVVKEARKFRMKNLGDVAGRRKTFGWKPVVGSPLGRQ